MLKDIVLVQKREIENRFQETYVKTEDIDTLEHRRRSDQGHFRSAASGKSFYAIHLLQQTGSYGYVNFDDERLTALEDYDEIVGAVNTVYGNPHYLLFDEIQNLPRWEMFVNRLQRQGIRLLITGSMPIYLVRNWLRI